MATGIKDMNMIILNSGIECGRQGKKKRALSEGIVEINVSMLT